MEQELNWKDGIDFDNQQFAYIYSNAIPTTLNKSNYGNILTPRFVQQKLWRDTNHLYMSDDFQEVYDFANKKTLGTFNTPSWKPKQKVGFSNSSFPSLLLSRLGLPSVTRSVKFDSADYIITDDLNISESRDTYIVGIDEKENWIILAYSYKDDPVKTHASIMQILKHNYPDYTFKYVYPFSEKRRVAEEEYSKYASKYVNTDEFIKYIYSQIPPLDEDEMKSLISMVTSKDSGLGFNTLVYYNFLDYLPDLLKSLVNQPHNHNYSKNISAQYIYYLLKCSTNTLMGLRDGSSTRRINGIANLKHNPFMTQTALNRLKDIISDQIESEINKVFKDSLEVIDAKVEIKYNINDKG